MMWNTFHHLAASAVDLILIRWSDCPSMTMALSGRTVKMLLRHSMRARGAASSFIERRLAGRCASQTASMTTWAPSAPFYGTTVHPNQYNWSWGFGMLLTLVGLNGVVGYSHFRYIYQQKAGRLATVPPEPAEPVGGMPPTPATIPKQNWRQIMKEQRKKDQHDDDEPKPVISW
jgi:hypothetical protein